jgi:hypothetical protein
MAISKLPVNAPDILFIIQGCVYIWLWTKTVKYIKFQISQYLIWPVGPLRGCGILIFLLLMPRFGCLGQLLKLPPLVCPNIQVLFNDCLFYFVYLKGLISLLWNIIIGKIFVYMGHLMNDVWFLNTFSSL